MRFAWRRLWKFRGSSLTSIVLLAVGLGAATAIFSVANAYVFRPMFPGQERLYAIWPELPNGNRVEISYPEFLDWQSELEGFSKLAVMWSSTLKHVVRSDGELHVVPFRWVSASFFGTLAVAPHLGRTFEVADTEPGAACAAVVSYGFWQAHFGGTPDVLGRILEGEEQCTIVGVMPRGFAFPRNLPNLERVELDATVLAFAVVAAFAATLLSTLAAAGTWRRSHRGRVRDGLVVAEVALAMVLLTGAGLCFRSFHELRKIELGFETERVLSAIFLYPDTGYPELEDRRRLVHAVLDRVRSLPGVESAATVLLRPFESDNVGWSSYLLLEGQPLDSSSFTRNPEVNFEAVTPGYFQTMGIPLLEGRDFTELDTDDSPKVVIVTRDLAERLWPGEPAIGQRLFASFGSKMFDENRKPILQIVVGVVEKASYRGLLSQYFDLYVPYRQSDPQPNNLVVRTAGEPGALASLLRESIRDVDPAIAVTGVTTLEAMVEREFRPWRFNVQLFSFLGVTATLLAAIGLGGLLAIGVRERTREMGIRAAIGATPAHLLRAFLWRGMALAGAGMMLGLVGSVSIARFIRSLLYGDEPWDYVTLAGVMSTLLVTAFAASLLPAGKASRISPSDALRHP